MSRPTRAEQLAAANSVIADVLADELNVLFCGINPGLYSGATGQHFARPGNRFWPILHRSGFTAQQLAPQQQHQLLTYGLGITNVVARTTARADELSAEELRDGAARLVRVVHSRRPRCLAVLGLGAYRVAFGAKKASVGRQDSWAETEVWVLPNPSGLNAHYTVEKLTEEFAHMRRALGLADAREPIR